MWMKAARPPSSERSCSTSSTTGPQVRLWHSAGVAKTRITGRRPRTFARSTLCMPSGGTRVSILDRSPPTEAAVGVCTRIAGCPTLGGPPGTPAGASDALDATSRSSRRTSAISTWRALVRGMWAT